jgi:hypothetical protein
MGLATSSANSDSVKEAVIGVIEEEIFSVPMFSTKTDAVLTGRCPDVPGAKYGTGLAA